MQNLRLGRAMGVMVWLLTAFLLTTGLCRPVYGAESSVIESVSITFKSSFGEPEEIKDPEVTTGGKGYELGDILFRTDYDKWAPGKKVRVELTLNALEDKVFSSAINRSKCKVTGADFVSARALDDTTLQVKIDYKPVSVLGSTERAGWSSTDSRKALWKTVNYAPGYNVTLYADNKVVKRQNVTVNYADLGDYMKDTDKTYYYEVKAVPVTSEDKKYMKEGAAVTSEDQEFDWDEMLDQNGGGRTTDGGDIKGDQYILPDGSKAVNTWKKVGTNWYFFDGDGNMVRGWLYTGDRWYYMDESGRMCTGWKETAADTWFYLGDNGEMRTGWTQIGPTDWYYLDQNGYMQRGWLSDNGYWYYLDENGRMKTGWVLVNGVWFYLNNDGTMAADTFIDGWNIGPDGQAYK